MAKEWDKVLGYWFAGLAENDGKWTLPKETTSKHWMQSDATDKEVTDLFTKDIERALAGEFADWEEDPQGCLAKTILVDQFTRHVYRGKKEAFSGDEIGARLAKLSWEKGYWKQAKDPQIMFHFMPLMHVECLETQALLIHIEKERGTYDPKGFAQRHYDLIEKFGRFPHRNKILGRENTPEETEALKDKSNSF